MGFLRFAAKSAAFATLAGACVAGGLYFLPGKRSGQTELAPLPVVAVREATLHPRAVAVGEALPAKTWRARTRRGGVIAAANPNAVAGSRVAEGEWIVRFDQEAERIAVDGAKAALALADAELAELDARAEAIAEALEKHPRDAEMANEERALPTRRATLEAKRAVAIASLDAAQLALDWTEVRAPFAGWILSVDVAEGTRVEADAEIVVAAVDEPAELILAIHSSEFAAVVGPAGRDALAAGDRSALAGAVGAIDAELRRAEDGASSEPVPAWLAPEPIASLGERVELRFLVDRVDAQPRGGQPARFAASLRGEPIPFATLIPASAINADGAAFVLREDGSVESWSVDIDFAAEGVAVAANGVVKGDRVATDPFALLGGEGRRYAGVEDGIAVATVERFASDWSE